jgi:hypothetical protein
VSRPRRGRSLEGLLRPSTPRGKAKKLQLPWAAETVATGPFRATEGASATQNSVFGIRNSRLSQIFSVSENACPHSGSFSAAPILKVSRYSAIMRREFRILGYSDFSFCGLPDPKLLNFQSPEFRVLHTHTHSLMSTKLMCSRTFGHHALLEQTPPDSGAIRNRVCHRGRAALQRA